MKRIMKQARIVRYRKWRGTMDLYVVCTFVCYTSGACVLFCGSIYWNLWVAFFFVKYLALDREMGEVVDSI